MLAGFAEIEFTPAEGAIPGQITPGYATDKLTPLMSHAAVIESRGVTPARATTTGSARTRRRRRSSPFSSEMI